MIAFAWFFAVSAFIAFLFGPLMLEEVTDKEYAASAALAFVFGLAAVICIVLAG